MRNQHSPRQQFRAILREHMEARNYRYADYCYIATCQGIGDRLAYLSLLSGLRNSGRKICLLYQSGDGLSPFYHRSVDLAIDIGNIFLDPWIHGDDVLQEGGIFFTWHVLYAGGVYQEKGGVPGVFDGAIGGHKFAVRASMGLPLETECTELDLSSGECTDNRRPYVLLSPIANSSKSLVGEDLEFVIDTLRSSSMDIVLNVGNRGLVDERYLQIPGVSFFAGPLSQLVEMAKAAFICLNMRSGFSELCSVIGARYADIYLGDLSRHQRFWSLAQNFLAPPVFESRDLLSFRQDFLRRAAI